MSPSTPDKQQPYPPLADILPLLSPPHANLVETAKHLYQEHLVNVAQQMPTHEQAPVYVCSAPGRVNLIGEHVDYQDGLVLPLALDEQYSIVVYGTGVLQIHTTTDSPATETSLRVRLVSDQADRPERIEERRLSGVRHSVPPPPDDDNRGSWVNYVVGVMVQYLPDLPATGCVLDVALAYASNVPLGSGLSSSAALEVVTATFLEGLMLQKGSGSSMAYSGAMGEEEAKRDDKVTKALRCQKAENTWAFSPCGIMDQFAVSCAQKDHLMLIDCRSLDVTHVPMAAPTTTAATEGTNDCSKTGESTLPSFLVCNSNVKHAIADGAYGTRRKECDDAVAALQQCLSNDRAIESLRDVTLADVEAAKASGKLTDILERRARHVVSENERTQACCAALRDGQYETVGALMNASHESLSTDFEVSCAELDVLVEIAQRQSGVYGSRMTGGGFGGCTVTLVQPEAVLAVIEALTQEYKKRTGKKCDCFVTVAGEGARVLANDQTRSC